MESEKDFTKWYYNFWFANGAILFFSTLSLLGYWYLSSEHPNSFLVLLLKEAGVAGYIVCILNLSAEWVNAKRHHEKEFRMIKKLNEELFLAVYGRDIDKSIVDHINENILKSNIIRRNCVWFVTLEYKNELVKSKTKK